MRSHVFLLYLFVMTCSARAQQPVCDTLYIGGLPAYANAKIEIDAACECLTGNVQVTLGTLDADANFRTTGQLTMGGSDSLIDVASTKSAKFSLGSLPSCVGGGGGSE